MASPPRLDLSARLGLRSARFPHRRPDIATAAPAVPVARSEARWLGAILLAALFARVLALLLLDEAVYSDAAAYLEMARTAIAGPAMRDVYGDYAAFAPGYPLLLSAAFRLFGSDPAVARGVNLLLGLVTVLLTWAVGRRATGRPIVGLIAAAGAALLIPAVASTEMLERENLATPLLLLFVWLALGMGTTRPPFAQALLAGTAFGWGVLAGASMLPTVAAFVVAVASRRPRPARAFGLSLAFAAATMLVLTPWLARNDRLLGRPVLGTGTGQALYIGNNSYADGGFVSIADTPLGPYWGTFRKLNGEARQSGELTAMALDHAARHPGETLLLDLHKLLAFWLPDIPGPDDGELGPVVTAARWAGALQHVLILALAGIAILGRRRWPSGLWLVALAIGAFWAVHGIAYVVARHRLPAMPLMLVLAAVPVADLLTRRRPRGTSATVPA